MLSIGIVGLPNVGKSLLFNLLTKSHSAKTENFPFCTIDPNIGIVEVKDEKIDILANIVNTNVKKYAVFEFVDIAGIVKGASQGEGLGNKFLSHIRSVDAIVIVLRCFENNDVIHVHNNIDPKYDLEIILLELILADQESLNKQIINLEKQIKTNNKTIITKYETAKKIKQTLDNYKLAIETELNKDELEISKDFFLLTMKKIMYVLNVDENQLKNIDKKYLKNKDIDNIINIQYNLNFSNYNSNNLNKFLEDNINAIVLPINLKFEEQLIDFNDNDAKIFLNELGLQNSGLDRLINAGFQLLDLITFFTAGSIEVKAWPVLKNTTAQKAAGKIHSDFEKKFIKAEVTDYENFVRYNGWNGVKENGKLRLEGKDYIVQNNDIIIFKVGA